MSDDPKTGPGSTDDPNQANNTGSPRSDKWKDLPDHAQGREQTNPDIGSGPGTTSDPNQANLT